MTVTNILTGEKETYIPFMSANMDLFPSLKLRWDLVTKSIDFVDVNSNDFDEFVVEAIKHFINMLECSEAKEQGKAKPEPMGFETTVEEVIRKMKFVYTKNDTQRINDFINDSLEERLRFIMSIEENQE